MCGSARAETKLRLRQERNEVGNGKACAKPTEHLLKLLTVLLWAGSCDSESIKNNLTDCRLISAFTAPTTLVTCSLLGKVAEHTVTYAEDSTARLTTTWTSTATDLAKVNALTASAEWLIIGGFSEDGKGVAEVWKLSVGEVPSSHD